MMVLLNDEQHSKGKATLLEIALSMKDHEEGRLGKNLSQGGNQTNVGESANFSPTSEVEDFEKILDRQAKRRKIAAEATDGSALRRYKMDFTNALSNMENIDRSSKVAIMDAISMYPDILQKVAYSVTALPPTQVSVERLFSALRIIRSDLRCSMKEDLTEAILFLRTNGF
ncbi:unnamed protein product [Clavelina lepadiformis]|uniref:HAT C-terminal dimerisation domain-containing protein n=1 Tax=Clavelina lepadiformis TaxID=159417 RepID=A0ABP0GED5_CLALP